MIYQIVILFLLAVIIYLMRLNVRLNNNVSRLTNILDRTELQMMDCVKEKESMHIEMYALSKKVAELKNERNKQ